MPCKHRLPEALERMVCRITHHATVELPELTATILDTWRFGLLPDEEVLGAHNGELLPCRIIDAHPPDNGGIEQASQGGMSGDKIPI
jgi:hypothetical protein